MTLGLIVLATAACDNRQGARQEASGTPQASATPGPAKETASLAAAAPASHKIEVTLRVKNGKCVAEDPGPKTVEPCDYVRWKYKNRCEQGKKKPKIDGKNAPISGDCLYETEIDNGADKEGKDCRVANDADVGTHKYGIHGDGLLALDPELEIPPPPPPQKAAKPTPCPQ